MNFIFEDRTNLKNFINCNDVNRSGISRFGTAPIISPTHIYYSSKNIHDELKYFDVGDDVKDYIIASCVNHSPDDWTGFDPKVKSFFYHLNEKYLRDLRNNEAYLLLDQSLEGYQTSWLWDYFHNQCKEFEVCPTRIIYVTGNMIADVTYKAWADSNGIEKRLKVIPYPHFELDMGMTASGKNNVNSKNPLPTIEKHIDYKTNNLEKIKTFACLNKRIRPHRVWFYYYLYHSGLIDDGLVSMNEFDIHWYNFEGKHFLDGELEEVSKILPLLVYGQRNDELDDNFYINRFNDQICLDTYMTVISEAHCGDSDQTMFLSEKTFKVIACRHPFMIMGNKDSLKMMRKIGYKTFDGFIDESYDSLPTHDRMNAIIESIKKVNNIKDKLSWFTEMRDVIEYNYSTLMNKLERPPDAYLEIRKYINLKKII